MYLVVKFCTIFLSI